MFMTNEQVGMYIRLLCAQHQLGHLTEEHMIKICGSYDENVFSKFKKDADGKYYNERCEIEILKRKKYIESRSANRKKSSKPLISKEKQNKTYVKHMKNISKSYEKHMENENENENINIIEDIDRDIGGSRGKKGKKQIPELDEFLDYCRKSIPAQYPTLEFALIAKYESWIDAGWKDGFGKPIKSWKSKIKSTIPHLKPLQNGNEPKIGRMLLSDLEKFRKTKPIFINPPDESPRGA